MLARYVEVEQLGPIYVCDACCGMSEALLSVSSCLPLYFKTFLKHQFMSYLSRTTYTNKEQSTLTHYYVNKIYLK